MKKILSTLAVGAFAISISTSMHASQDLYVDFGFGYSELVNMPEASTFSDLTGVTVEGEPTSTADNYGGRLAGGVLWDAKESIAYGLEAAAAYYGVVKYSNQASGVDMNYYGLELLGVIQFNVDKLNFIGKLGATDEILHATKTNINNSNLNGTQQLLPEIAAGVAYGFTPDLQLGVTYYRTFGSSVSFTSSVGPNNLPSVNMALLEFKYFI